MPNSSSWADTQERIGAGLDKLRADACEAGEAEVKRILGELATRFPRHSFQLVDGMGVTFVDVSPWVLNSYDLGDIADRLDSRFGELDSFMRHRNSAILAICEWLDRELQTGLGPGVKPD